MIPYGAKRFAIKNGKPRASGDDPCSEYKFDVPSP